MLCKGLIVKFPRKGERTQCTNWYGVTLLFVPSKVSVDVSFTLRKEQEGFRPEVGCIDHIFTLRNFMEHCIEWNTSEGAAVLYRSGKGLRQPRDSHGKFKPVSISLPRNVCENHISTTTLNVVLTTSSPIVQRQ